MAKKESMNDRERRFARIWVTSRTVAGKTQEFMAKGLGVSKKTIQNWENGTTAPDLYTGSEWFRILGINPLPYYQSFLFPSLFNVDQTNSDDVVDQALEMLIKSSSTAEKKKLLYLMAGQHGSPWNSLLQAFTAYCHISMKSRVNIAQAVFNDYEMEKATGDLVCTDDVFPDMSIFKRALEEGKKSVIKGQKGYTNVRFKEEEEEEEE